MKQIIVLLLLFFSGNLFSQHSNSNYDASLAKKLNADDNGMKMYVLVILETGETKVKDGSKRDSLYKGHFANINHLVAMKKLVVAGPFNKNDNNYRGIFIIDVNSIEEAKDFLKNDPTISEGIFSAKYYEWYGSAALPEYLNTADKIWKKKP